MHSIFKTYTPREIVPLDSTVHESYIIKCLKKSVQTKDACYITSALHSLCIAIERLTQKKATSDMLLDTLIPILQSKCNVQCLRKALQSVQVNLDGDANGATGYSMCLFQSATMEGCKINNT